MKKLLLLFTLLLSLSACSSDEPVVQPETEAPVEDNILPGYRTRQEIIDIAQEYADILYPASVKSRSARKVVDESRVFALSDLKSRSTGDSDIAPLICIVEYNDDNGFAIIATPKEVEPVIAVVDHGSYSDSIANSIPAFQYFMEMATDYVATQKEIVDNGPFIGPNDTLPYLIKEYKTEIDTTFAFYADPVIKTNRGQYYPECLLCPNKLSGCFPTAALMICEYFKEPSYLKLTYDNSPMTIYLDWDVISQVKSNKNKDGAFTLQNLPIAQFTRQVGHLADANYKSSNRTSVNRDKEQPTLCKLLPKRIIGNLQDYDFYPVYEAIKDKGLVMFAGNDTNGAGHVWVADGMRYLRITKNEYERPVKGFHAWKLTSSSESVYRYIHFNWGANGDYNCYSSAYAIKNTEYDYSKHSIYIVTIR